MTASTNPVYSASTQKGGGAAGGGMVGGKALSGAAGGGADGGVTRMLMLAGVMPAALRGETPGSPPVRVAVGERSGNSDGGGC